jgi:glyoxylase-like metal-dependent hydrolase (beta-lactamase superfamily II)
MRGAKTPRRSHQNLWSRRRLIGAGIQALPACGALSLGSTLAPVIARAQKVTPDILTTDLDGLILLQGAGSNVVAMPGEDGALMIDGGLADYAEALLRSVFLATGNDRVEMLINTHWHREQTGANELVGDAGGTIFAQEKTAMYLSNTVFSGVLGDRIEPLPESAWPTQTTRGDGSFEFAGQEIDFGYLPQAHTDGDLYVHFPEMNLLAAGGVVSGEEWPLIDYGNGAWYGGRVRALQWLAELVEADTRVVPAQGRLITGRDIVRQRDIYLELFETMIGYMNMGLGAEDVVERNPLAGYESEFGDPGRFLDGAYRSMQIAYVPD